MNVSFLSCVGVWWWGGNLNTLSPRKKGSGHDFGSITGQTQTRFTLLHHFLPAALCWLVSGRDDLEREEMEWRDWLLALPLEWIAGWKRGQRWRQPSREFIFPPSSPVPARRASLPTHLLSLWSALGFPSLLCKHGDKTAAFLKRNEQHNVTQEEVFLFQTNCQLWFCWLIRDTPTFLIMFLSKSAKKSSYWVVSETNWQKSVHRWRQVMWLKAREKACKWTLSLSH